MTTITEQTILTLHATARMLHELGIPIHRNGYRQLCIAIPCYAQQDIQSLSKELYPYVADYFGQTNWQAVERSIRDVILDAWEHRDPEVWEVYFPKFRKVPSNKMFISTLAEHLSK